MTKIMIIADQIVLREKTIKFAAENSELFKKLNDAFNMFIKKNFMSIKMKAKVPYSELSPKEKERVWNDFWKSNEIQKLVEKNFEIER